MTLHELALRDLRKAEINLEHAKKKPNVTQFELERLEELCALRKKIFDIVTTKGATDERAD
jgi:hypothetical protein